jgi:integrase
MPKSARRPSYLLHRPSGQARVRIDGVDRYLGKYRSPESHARYDALVDDWLRRRAIDRATLTIDELALRFLDHAVTYYAKDGVPTSEVARIRSAFRPMIKLYGNTLAAAFGPLRLKEVRAEMIRLGWKRKAINGHVKRIKRAFRWAVENELMFASKAYKALESVRGLARGRTAAIEGKRVKPVPAAFVDAIKPHVCRHVWAMVQVQRLTGARPGEIVAMRVGNLNTHGRIWEYVPPTHKNEHLEHDRLILIGPKAQAVLRDFLETNIEAFVFSPIEADAERQAARRASRKSPMTPSQAARRPKVGGRRRPKDRYTVASYRRAIARACVVAKVPVWHPHQLRHTAATELRREYGVEIARTILGHASLDATEIYAEADWQRARQVALEFG